MDKPTTTEQKFPELGEDGMKKFRQEVKFGCTIKNHWASDNNPNKTGYFIMITTHGGQKSAMVTNGQGRFWYVVFDRWAKLEIVRESPFDFLTNQTNQP